MALPCILGRWQVSIFILLMSVASTQHWLCFRWQPQCFNRTFESLFETLSLFSFVYDRHSTLLITFNPLLLLSLRLFRQKLSLSLSLSLSLPPSLCYMPLSPYYMSLPIICLSLSLSLPIIYPSLPLSHLPLSCLFVLRSLPSPLAPSLPLSSLPHYLVLCLSLSPSFTCFFPLSLSRSPSLLNLSLSCLAVFFLSHFLLVVCLPVCFYPTCCLSLACTSLSLSVTISVTL